ncbi:MAG: hypothetical protein ACRDXX_02425 [Stackebrandtia sp.]
MGLEISKYRGGHLDGELLGAVLGAEHRRRQQVGALAVKPGDSLPQVRKGRTGRRRRGRRRAAVLLVRRKVIYRLCRRVQVVVPQTGQGAFNLLAFGVGMRPGVLGGEIVHVKSRPDALRPAGDVCRVDEAVSPEPPDQLLGDVEIDAEERGGGVTVAVGAGMLRQQPQRTLRVG